MPMIRPSLCASTATGGFSSAANCRPSVFPISATAIVTHCAAYSDSVRELRRLEFLSSFSEAGNQ